MPARASCARWVRGAVLEPSSRSGGTMQPLTHQLWAKHFTVVRPRVLEEWPEIDKGELDHVGDDWDGLVELVHKTAGMSADLTRQRLRTLDVEELGIGTGEPA